MRGREQDWVMYPRGQAAAQTRWSVMEESDPGDKRGRRCPRQRDRQEEWGAFRKLGEWLKEGQADQGVGAVQGPCPLCQEVGLHELLRASVLRGGHCSDPGLGPDRRDHRTLRSWDIVQLVAEGLVTQRWPENKWDGGSIGQAGQ